MNDCIRLGYIHECLHCIGLHDSNLSLEEFYYLYKQLPSEHTDLATRWTDYNDQTLLYRLALYKAYSH